MACHIDTWISLPFLECYFKFDILSIEVRSVTPSIRVFLVNINHNSRLSLKLSTENLLSSSLCLLPCPLLEVRVSIPPLIILTKTTFRCERDPVDLLAPVLRRGLQWSDAWDPLHDPGQLVDSGFLVIFSFSDEEDDTSAIRSVSGEQIYGSIAIIFFLHWRRFFPAATSSLPASLLWWTMSALPPG